MVECINIIIRILHELKGHYNIKFIRNNGLIMIDSFEFEESWWFFENEFFDKFNLKKMMNQELATKLLDEYFLYYMSEPIYPLTYSTYYY